MAWEKSMSKLLANSFGMAAGLEFPHSATTYYFGISVVSKKMPIVSAAWKPNRIQICVLSCWCPFKNSIKFSCASNVLLRLTRNALSLAASCQSNNRSVCCAQIPSLASLAKTVFICFCNLFFTLNFHTTSRWCSSQAIHARKLHFVQALPLCLLRDIPFDCDFNHERYLGKRDKEKCEWYRQRRQTYCLQRMQLACSRAIFSSWPSTPTIVGHDSKPQARVTLTPTKNIPGNGFGAKRHCGSN